MNDYIVSLVILFVLLGFFLCALVIFTRMSNSKRKEDDDMAVVYVTLIVKGLKALEDVPARIKKQVEELLAALEV